MHSASTSIEQANPNRAFPTPLTSYDLTYHVYSTRASTTLGATSSTLSTLLPYSPTLPAPIPSPNNMQGTHYTLATYSAIGDLFFYTSAFPEQKALQTCSPIAWLGGNLYIGFQPPVAVQFTKLQSVTYLYNSRSDTATTQGSVVLPGSPETSSALNMYQQGPVHVATQAQKPTAVFSAMFTLPHPGIDKNTNIRPPASSATLTARPSLQVSSLPPSTPPAITWDNSVITADSATRYKIGTQTLYPHGPAITEQGTTLSLASSGEAVVVNGHTSPLVKNRPSPKPTQPAVSIGSGSYVLEGGPTVIPGGSAVVFSGTTYSALSSGTAIVINGQTIRPTMKSTDDVQVVHGLTVENAGGSKVLVDGHTLAMSATLIIGSGSIFTRVALTTDSDGNTFVMGYTGTTQAVTSTSSIPSLALGGGSKQSTVAQSSESSSGTGNASSATRDVHLSQSVLMAVVLVVVVFISG